MSQEIVVDHEDLLITQGSLWVAIWHMTWPMICNMAAVALGSFVDMWVAGRLGPEAQAAMGIGGQIWYFMMMLAMAVEVGTIALVSRYFGARDMVNTIEAARQALIFAGIFGVLSFCIGLSTCRSLLQLLGASAAVEQQGWNYLKFSMISNIPWTLLWATQSIFRAIGAARTAMVMIVVTTILIILLDFVLCLFPFHMGIAGLGLSWIVATAVGFALSVLLLQKTKISRCLSIIDSLRYGLSKEWLLRFMKIGIPGCMQEIALIGGSFGLFSILSHSIQPTISQAAWAVGWRVEEIVVLMPMFAFNMAVATIVGQNLGAGHAKRAEQAGWKIAWAGVIINVLVATFLWVLAPEIAKLMSEDAAVVKASISYFRWIVWAEPLFATWFILSGAMQGAGYTRLPMIITVLCFDLLRLPLAWYLTVTLGTGSNGTWIAMALTSALAGILMAFVFKWGRWKYQTI